MNQISKPFLNWLCFSGHTIFQVTRSRFMGTPPTWKRINVARRPKLKSRPSELFKKRILARHQLQNKHIPTSIPSEVDYKPERMTAMHVPLFSCPLALNFGSFCCMSPQRSPGWWLSTWLHLRITCGAFKKY